ncbi:hypothetical protein BDZ91DRAFT_732728 [Kalaharituber pfeilii]|nr:hypothetical protein BDZ91DRAFT_732728 [Kalaharituber pfeilii]
MATPTPHPEFIADEFIKLYYSKFNANERAELQVIYRPESTVSFEQGKHVGISQIMAFFVQEFPFTKIRHHILTRDVQISQGGGLFILVTGIVQTDEDAPKLFSQSFYLVSDSGSFYVLNEAFRFFYGWPTPEERLY